MTMATKRKPKQKGFTAEELVAQMRRNDNRMPTKGSEAMRRKRKGS